MAAAPSECWGSEAPGGLDCARVPVALLCPSGGAACSLREAGALPVPVPSVMAAGAVRGLQPLGVRGALVCGWSSGSCKEPLPPLWVAFLPAGWGRGAHGLRSTRGRLQEAPVRGVGQGGGPGGLPQRGGVGAEAPAAGEREACAGVAVVPSGDCFPAVVPEGSRELWQRGGGAAAGEGAREQGARVSRPRVAARRWRARWGRAAP